MAKSPPKSASTGSGISKKNALALYRALVMTRAFDRVALRLMESGRVGFFVPSLSEEGATLGAALAMTPTDWIVPTFRQHGIALLRGIPASTLFASLLATSDDPAKGRSLPGNGGFLSAHVTSVSGSAGTQIAHGTGIAMAMARRGDDAACLTFFGEAATASNDFHAGVNFAGVYGAPVILACLHHEQGPHAHAGPGVPPEEMAEAYGIPAVRVHGDDALSVWSAVRSARQRARSGAGPTLLELVVGIDDPLALLEDHLLTHGLLDEAARRTLHGQSEQEIEAAAKDAENRPAPARSTAFSDVTALGSFQRADQERRSALPDSRGDTSADPAAGGSDTEADTQRGSPESGARRGSPPGPGTEGRGRTATASKGDPNAELPL